MGATCVVRVLGDSAAGGGADLGGDTTHPEGSERATEMPEERAALPQ